MKHKINIASKHQRLVGNPIKISLRLFKSIRQMFNSSFIALAVARKVLFSLKMMLKSMLLLTSKTTIQMRRNHFTFQDQISNQVKPMLLKLWVKIWFTMKISLWTMRSSQSTILTNMTSSLTGLKVSFKMRMLRCSLKSTKTMEESHRSVWQDSWWKSYYWLMALSS